MYMALQLGAIQIVLQIPDKQGHGNQCQALHVLREF